MSIKPETKPAVLEVPRVLVDFLEENPHRDLTPRHKESVLAAAALEDVVGNFGFQHFGHGVIENVVIEPVKALVVEQWGNDFVYNLSGKSLPLTFRAALATTLFYTRFAEHLSSMGEVEIYATREVKKLLEEHGISLRNGLNSVRFSDLPAELKRHLIKPMLQQVYQAKAVALAYHLFPNGIDLVTLGLVDPAAMFRNIFGGGVKERIDFSSITDLEFQVQIASACIENYAKIKEFDPTVTRVKRTIAEEREKKEAAQEEDLEKRLAQPERPEPKVPKYEVHPKGTTLYDALKNDANRKELERAWVLLTQEGTFAGYVEEPHLYERMVRMVISLHPDGTLRATYTVTSESPSNLQDITLDVSEDVLKEMGIKTREESSVTFDLLTTQVYEATGNYGDGRSVFKKQAEAVIEHYRDRELDLVLKEIVTALMKNREAIQKAQQQFGTTVFSIERGLWDALTADYIIRIRPNRALSGEAKENVEAREQKVGIKERLAQQAAQLIGKLEWLTGEGRQAEAKDYSSVPVPNEVLEVDYAILAGLRENSGLDAVDPFQIMFGTAELPNVLAGFLNSWSSLLSTFKESLLSYSYCFNVLSIAPTSDQAVIRKSFRNIAMDTHPDRTRHLPPEEQLVLTKKFVEAKQAYQQLMNSGGNLSTTSPVFYLGRLSQLFKQEGLEFLTTQ